MSVLVDRDIPSGDAKRIILTSGKVYYDLMESRKQSGDQRVAIVAGLRGVRLFVSGMQGRGVRGVATELLQQLDSAVPPAGMARMLRREFGPASGLCGALVLAVPALAHRIIVSADAVMSGRSAGTVVRELLDEVGVPLEESS